MNIRHVQISLDRMKKFANEMEKTQYHCDYVMILSIFIQKRNISFELPWKSSNSMNNFINFLNITRLF